MLELVERLGNSRIDDLRREASTDNISLADAKAELAGASRGVLIRLIVDQFLGYEDEGE
jgi:hypothetical protein